MAAFWIIESATRGVFREWRDSRVNWHGEQRPGFSTTGTRSEHSRKFSSLSAAQAELAKILPFVRSCYVLEMGKGYAQRCYDTAGFSRMSENDFTDFLHQHRLSGKGVQGTQYPLQWSIAGKVVAFEFYHHGERSTLRFARKE
jgi:hypothetical protein